MEFKNNRPIYLQIADALCGRILSGQYAEGDKMPSVRDTAVEMEVNVNTVARTFEWLQLNQIVVVRRGMGNFVAYGAREIIARLHREEFFNVHLPELFKRMSQLGVSIEEVMQEYKQFNNE